MKKSKSKPVTVGAAVGPRMFVAIHQDQLMESFARGFVPNAKMTLRAETVVTQGALDLAMEGQAWGSVVLVELAVPKATKPTDVLAIPSLLMLVDCISCWVESDDVAMEIQARLQTFDDTIPNALDIRVDPSLFPVPTPSTSADPTPEGSLVLDFREPAPKGHQTDDSVGDASVATEVGDGLEETLLEKVAGAVALMRWRSAQLDMPVEYVRYLLSVRDAGVDTFTSVNCLARFVDHAYTVIRRGDVNAEDLRIVSTAAAMLLEITPKEGFEPLAFARELGNRLSADCGSGGTADIKAFVETIEKIVDNRIELGDSKIDDTGRVGQRALLIFLLAPKAEQLERWIRARRNVGKDVSLLASVLAGLYCGIGGIPREMKGPDRAPFLATTAAARSIALGQVPSFEFTRSWDQSAASQVRLALSGHVLVERIGAPTPALAGALEGIRQSGRRLEVHAESGEITVAFDGTKASPIALIQIRPSAYRLPASDVLALISTVRPAKRGKPTRELLEQLLADSMHPVVARLAPSGVGIELTVENDLASDASLGFEALVRVARSLELVPVGTTMAAGRSTKGDAKKPRSPSTSPTDTREGGD